MKTAIVSALFLLAAINLHAEVKWITIKPMNPDIKAEKSVDSSKLQPVKKIIQNAKIIQSLIDGTNKKIASKEEGKNWYTIKNTDNN